MTRQRRSRQRRPDRQTDSPLPQRKHCRRSGPAKTAGELSADDLRKTKSSPLVRNIAKEHGIDISRLEGTGMSGRVTKNDILELYRIGRCADATTGDAARGKGATTVPQPVPTPAPVTPPQAGTGDHMEQMSVMRKRIAEHMTFRNELRRM